MTTLFKTEFALPALVAVLLLTGCGKKDVQTGGDTKKQMQVKQSVFVSQEDSIRWINHLRADPADTALAFIMLGVLYLANDYPETTVRYLNMAEKYDAGRAITYLNLGDAYNRIGMRMEREGKKDSMQVMQEMAAEAFRWYVQRTPRGMVTEEIYRIVEKYRSMDSEKETP